MQAALNAIDAELANLGEEEEAEFRANYADELLARLHDEERQLAKRAVPAIAKLRELTPEWAEVARSAHQLARAVAIVEPGAPTVTAAAIADGATFVPVVPEPVGVPRRDPGDHQERLRAARERLANRWSLPPR